MVTHCPFMRKTRTWSCTPSPLWLGMQDHYEQRNVFVILIIAVETNVAGEVLQSSTGRNRTPAFAPQAIVDPEL